MLGNGFCNQKKKLPPCHNYDLNVFTTLIKTEKTRKKGRSETK